MTLQKPAQRGPAFVGFVDKDLNAVAPGAFYGFAQNPVGGPSPLGNKPGIVEEGDEGFGESVDGGGGIGEGNTGEGFEDIAVVGVGVMLGEVVEEGAEDYLGVIGEPVLWWRGIGGEGGAQEFIRFRGRKKAGPFGERIGFYGFTGADGIVDNRVWVGPLLPFFGGDFVYAGAGAFGKALCEVFASGDGGVGGAFAAYALCV